MEVKAAESCQLAARAFRSAHLALGDPDRLITSVYQAVNKHLQVRESPHCSNCLTRSMTFCQPICSSKGPNLKCKVIHTDDKAASNRLHNFILHHHR